MKSIALGSVVVTAVTLSVGILAAPVSALTLVSGSGDTAVYRSGFANIPGGDTVGDGVFGRYGFTLQKTGTNVLFSIFNSAGAGNNSRIAEVYFDDVNGGDLLEYAIGGAVNVGNVGTVFFAGPAIGNPSNLPQGQEIDFEQNFAFGSISTGRGRDAVNQNENAIGAGETLGIRFGLRSGKTYQDVVNALNLHTLRVGIHVRDAVGSNSDAYATIPTPALLPGLIGLGIGAIRKRKLQQAEETEA